MIGVIDKIRIVCSLTITEFDFVDQVSFYEKPQCSVDGGTGGSGTGISKPIKQFIRGEVFIGREDNFENLIPLRSLSQTFFSDEIVQSFANTHVHIAAILWNLD